MNNWRDKLQLTTDDPTLTTSEVNELFAVLKEERIAPSVVAESADIGLEVLNDPAARISLRQQYMILRTAAAVCCNSQLPIRLARRLHLTTYGIAGYALLSSSSLRELINVAESYSPLLNLKFSMSLRHDGSLAHLCFIDRYAMDGAMRCSCAVLEIAKFVVLLRDVLGADFKPYAARCSCSSATEFKELSEFLGVKVQESTDRIEICFDAALLDRVLPQSHAGTHSACLQVCESLMNGLARRYTLDQQVKDIIRKADGRAPTLAKVASVLCVSQRTLRRRLEALDTSYLQILEDVRKELAIRYLTTTSFTTEAIAELLGYSEAANFRHAFKRWTGIPPRHYCAANGIVAAPQNYRAPMESIAGSWA